MKQPGELEFRIAGYGNGIRRTWGDGKTRRLETLLSKRIGALMYVRVDKDALTLRWPDSAKLNDKGMKKRWQNLLKKIKDEEKRVRDLDTWVTNWLRAEQVRNFVVALESAWTKEGHDLSRAAPKGQRIAWMKQQADKLDPMVAGPPSILDRKSELPYYLR